ncbi:Leucine-rich repeat and guanylate kinase domain-containing protein [Geodia barretti]|uniref:Leucine-rich repeat and guanylate kinase domain-containing protein n=3 Tax=Geodia barretti TaxID=519541 RepID=A0AA35RXF3_GEOBA|nr:Leucine-rich repeat and guanylate kinase domain-containing protein [Geodia barretti]
MRLRKLGIFLHIIPCRLLFLDGNQITAISGLDSLSRLSHLSLASNRIDTISNLTSLPLKYLRLSGNNIVEIENLETLTDLMVIDLSGNQISRLGGLCGHSSLMEIYLQENVVVEREELLHLKELKNLRVLSLNQNPIDTVPEYRSYAVFHLPFLTRLDGQTVRIEEKVSAVNRFSPPLEVVAAQDHRTNTKLAVQNKPASLRFSTLTRLDEPYPMLVMCGPPGSGHEQFVRHLVDEFPSFFGLGVSHTTQPQGPRQGHGRDYYFIDEGTFNRALISGEFLETHEVGGHRYGLTMAAVEQVAHQGLACVTHMTLQGVLTMKNTHFEPRYILTIPLTPQIHAQRMRSSGQYSEGEIKMAVDDVTAYQTLHQDRPGFFDAAINTDSIREGYQQLQALVMAYGDITPESPLSMSQVTVTSVTTTSHQTTPTPEMPTPTLVTHQESTLLKASHGEAGDEPAREGGSEEEKEGAREGERESSQPKPPSSPYHAPEVANKIKGMAQVWSRPPSSLAGSSRPVSGSDPGKRLGTRTPLSEFGERHQRRVEAAVAGKDISSYEQLFNHKSSMYRHLQVRSRRHAGNIDSSRGGRGRWGVQ